jgi:prepilin-type N-terminal cleavage/methylation domain-containing protein
MRATHLISTKNWTSSGMTLIEVMMASAIFAMTFGGMLIGQKMARQNTEKSLISFVITHHAQGLLEAIQSYRYDDSAYESVSSAQTLFSQQHSSNAYISDASGIYRKDSDTTPDAGLTNASFKDANGVYSARIKEESLSLRYYPTTAGTTAIIPFTRNALLQNNDRLIGLEDGDTHDGSLHGIFKITRKDQMRNIFANFDQKKISADNNGIGQEKYFYADDVDDFDGYREEKEILPKVKVTFDISIAGIYDNETNFTDNDLQTNPMPQTPYSLMNEVMSAANFQSKLRATPTNNAETLAFNYYNRMLLKKITVLATWEYPPGSGRNHTIVIDGGKMNPDGDAQ